LALTKKQLLLGSRVFVAKLASKNYFPKYEIELWLESSLLREIILDAA